MEDHVVAPRRRGWIKAVGISVIVFLAIWVSFYYIFTDVGRAAASEAKLRQQIEAKGYFSTTEGYEKMITVPDDQNAATEFKELQTSLGKFDFDKKPDAELLAFMRSKTDVLNQFAKVVEKPSMVVSRDRKIPAAVTFPEYYYMKLVVKVLSREASIEHKAGNDAVAMRNWKIAARVADYCDDEHTMIGDLVRKACTMIIERQLRNADSQKALTPAQASQLLEVFAPLDGPIDFRSTIKSEYWFETASFSEDISAFDLGKSGAAFDFLRKVPKFKEASMARIHEAYLGFEKDCKGDDLLAARTALLNLEKVADEKGLSYKYYATLSPVFSGYANALVEDHNARQNLFSWLEAKAGKPKKRIAADGSPITQ